MRIKITHKKLFAGAVAAAMLVLGIYRLGNEPEEFFFAKKDSSTNEIAERNFSEDEGSLPGEDAEKRDESAGERNRGLAEEKILPEFGIIGDVPFTSQAPFGGWSDPRQQHGCEEASLIMAAYWILGKSLTPEISLREINAVSDFEEKNYANAYDLSIADTLNLWNEYFGYGKASVKYDFSSEDIKEEIASGRLVIVPIDGRKLGNPYYTAPGPEFHEIVVIGYDDKKEEFIVHDPGTRHGESYRYDYDIFMDSIRDYKTGFNEAVTEKKKAMMTIGKE